APARRVELHARTRGADAHASVEVHSRAALPLAQRQVCDLVALSCQSHREVAIPALAAPDRIGEEAVIDNADPHPASISSRPSPPRCDPFRPSEGYKRGALHAATRIWAYPNISR